MKKIIKAVLVVTLGLLVITGCSNKKATPKTNNTQKEVTTKKEDSTKKTDDDILSELLVDDSSNQEVASNNNVPSSSDGESKQKIQIMEDDINYNELEYDRHENVVFNCDYVQDATQKDGDITVLATKIKGSISGLPGTYELVVPYSLEWKRGDKALVNYEIAYEGEFTSYVRDIEFLQKINNEYIERQKELQAKLDEERKLQEESEKQAEEEARILEEEKKKKEEEAKKWREAQAKREEEAKRAAAEEAQRIQESINAEIAAQEAQKSKVIGPAGQ